jgi:hypothetical protein
VPASVIRRLARFFERNGYARWQASRRVEEEGWQRYKKGDEVRLVANSAAELKVIRALLRAAGFRPGRPFAKGRQYRQPLYGRQVVVAFLALVERARKAARRASKTALRRRGSRVTSLARRQR